jgi:glycosyltransferase involved in cell wall biosynthesis
VDLREITPLILTYNEEANIGRTLDRLTWAKQILVVDSHSDDATLDIVADYPQADILQRPFDSFAGQCNFGLDHIDTEWVLSLDADYVLSEGFTEEVRRLPSNPSADGYTASFVHCVFGDPIRATLYPPRTVLYRRARASYRQDGHAHQVEVDGATETLDSAIYHDDRKSLGRWLSAQQEYTEDEIEKYRSLVRSELSWPDRIRRRTLSPILVFFYCLFAKGLILDGKAGWYYTLRRTYAELLLALALMDEELRTNTDKRFSHEGSDT